MPLWEYIILTYSTFNFNFGNLDLIILKLIERFLVYYCYVSGSLNVRLTECKFILKKTLGQAHFDLNFILVTLCYVHLNWVRQGLVPVYYNCAKKIKKKVSFALKNIL